LGAIYPGTSDWNLIFFTSNSIVKQNVKSVLPTRQVKETAADPFLHCSKNLPPNMIPKITAAMIHNKNTE